MLSFDALLLSADSGTEVAGEVVEVGSKVLRLKPGDRVVALQQSGGGYAEEMIAEDKVSIWLSQPCAL